MTSVHTQALDDGQAEDETFVFVTAAEALHRPGSWPWVTKLASSCKINATAYLSYKEISF